MKKERKTKIEHIKKSRFLVITDNKNIVKIIYKLKNGKEIYGFSKCNLKEDTFSFTYGFELALGRAMVKIYKNLDKSIENIKRDAFQRVAVNQRRLTKELKKRNLFEMSIDK